MTDNIITNLFSQLKKTIGSSKFNKQTIQEMNSKIVEMENLATKAGQDELLQNLKGHYEFNRRFIEDIIPAGFDTYINLDDVNKILSGRGAKNEFDDLKPLVMKPVVEFPRPIPADCVEKIETARPLFDDIYILYTDYTGKDRELDKEYQKEKDPIALGILRTTVSSGPKLFSSKMVFICDWVDDYCDLTLEKLINEYKVEAHSLSEDINKDTSDVTDSLNG